MFIAAWVQPIIPMLSAQMPNKLRLNFPTLHHALLCKNYPKTTGGECSCKKELPSPKTTSLTLDGLQVQAYEPTEDRGSKAEHRKVELNG
ncbi:MAG: hypothetical protein A2107_00535 [Verrucomicrobia bacterium GWF2_62_7]|nr:MAG: hypothetical protein A2107_00535 [Verrucomicrobia bacterium GWF2_62_7]